MYSKLQNKGLEGMRLLSKEDDVTETANHRIDDVHKKQFYGKILDFKQES